MKAIVLALVLSGCSFHPVDDKGITCEEAMEHFYSIECKFSAGGNMYLTPESAVGWCQTMWVRAFDNDSACEHELLDVLICARFVAKDNCSICFDSFERMHACSL